MVLPIQNLRSGIADKRPLASGLANGQIAINYHEGDPGIYIKGESGALIKVAPTYVGTTAPNASPATGGATGNAKGETWLDTSTTPASLKIFDGSSFVASYAFTNIELAGTYTQAITTLSGSVIDCSLGNYFVHTVNGAVTYSFSNVPAAKAFSITLEVTHTSGTVAWPAEVKFPANVAPVLTAGKTHLFVLLTDDGGSRWRAAALADFDN